MSNPNPPPQPNLNGNLYAKRTDESGVSASGSAGAFSITTYFPLASTPWSYSDGTSVTTLHKNSNPYCRSIYLNQFGRDAKSATTPRGAYAFYIETSKFYATSWTSLNETQRYTVKMYFYKVGTSGQTSPVTIVPEISWNTPYTRANDNIDLNTTINANPSTVGTHINNVLYPGWYYWDVSGNGEGLTTTTGSSTGWVSFDFSKGVSQVHYDKYYGEHDSENYHDVIWIRLRDKNSPHSLSSATWSASKDTANKYVYVGDTANSNLCKFYDTTGKYPPYGTYTHSLFNNFAIWNPSDPNTLFQIANDTSQAVYIDAAPIVNSISQGTTYLGSPDHYSRMWLKIRLPVNINGLVLASLLELYVNSSLDSNRILSACPYVSSNTSWNNSSTWNIMEGIYNNAHPTLWRNWHQPIQAALNSSIGPYYFYFHGTPLWQEHGVLTGSPETTIPYLIYYYRGLGASYAEATIMLRELNSPSQINETVSNTTTNSLKLGTSGTFLSAAPSQKTFSSAGGTAPRMIYVYLPPIIKLNPTVINVTTAAGVNPSPSTFVGSNIGYGIINITYSDNVAWLSLNTSTGAALEINESETVQISYNTTSLAPGIYAATITATNPSALPTSKTLTVNLTVTNNSYIVRSPSSFEWTITRGSTLPTGTLQVWDGNSSSSDQIIYNITSSQTWCNISPTSGSSTNSSNKQNHIISFDSEVALYSPGTYNATLTITDTVTADVATVSVQLNIIENAKSSPSYGAYIL
jgi:hypothetical protein